MGQVSRTFHETYRAYTPRPLSASERNDVTIVFGGVTWRAERALEGLLRNAGYQAQRLPEVTREDLFLGRELVDVGQCCPTAFTTGNLANFLLSEAERIGPEKVAEKYVYVTANSCGACRFAQYHQSYELALKNLGFESFRLFLIQQTGIDQGNDEDMGFQTSPHLLLGAVAAFAMADVVQDLEYQTRPYEIERGATDRAAKKAVEEIFQAMLARPKRETKSGAILWHLTTSHFVKALQRARQHFEAIEIDPLRVRPVVEITGEIYLSTVEGVQNYNIHSWLEQEGAEVKPAPMAVWFDYLIRFAAQTLVERDGIVANARGKIAILKVAERLFRARYDGMRKALGGVPRRLPDQAELRDLAAPFYDNGINGGEGDMLIAKAIWAHRHRTAHMICELSPYGCLPNTMSVGAMAEVLGRYPDMLYAPIEIKGDSEVHALSRCQMVLTEAKSRAKDEFAAALKATGLTLDEARARMNDRPEMRSPFWRVPNRGAIGKAANVVLELGNARL